MAAKTRKKLVAQVNSKTLSAVRAIARSEGRHLRALIEEALVDLIEKRKQNRLRTHVMMAYQASHERFGPLYKKLAE